LFPALFSRGAGIKNKNTPIKRGAFERACFSVLAKVDKIFDKPKKIIYIENIDNRADINRQ